ncbi:hypothetical protein C0995_012386 [Termitomyces sp. Mi166|nr:hypothetical protein C0995_012386 [Termitomyces sp. Mi166\
MRKLWGTSIFGLHDPGDASIIRRAIDILPEVAYVSVAVRPVLGTSDFVKIKDALIPLLSRIDELNCLMCRKLWHLLPSQALSRLSTLRFDLVDPERDGTIATQTSSLFGESPRLKNLKLCSNACPPEFDYPWHQLTSLSLTASNFGFAVSFDESARRIWIELFNRLCFDWGSGLRELRLDLQGNMLLDFISLQFPWQQLTRFHVSCRGDEKFLSTIQVIRKCTALVDLGLYLYPDITTNDPVVLQPLEILHLSYVPPCLLHSPSIWPELLELHVDRFTLSLVKFFEIGRQCCRLVKFSGVLSEPFVDEIEEIKETVFLNLRDLELKVRGPLSVFDLLRTPALSALTVYRHVASDFRISPISRYLVRSKCRLESFELDGQFKDDEIHFRVLLSSLTHCTHLCLRGILPVPSSVLDDIASGILLPHVECMHMRMRTVNSFLAMVKRRLEMEAGQGRVRLREITGILTFEEPDPHVLKRRLGELEKTYNVSLRYER